MASIALAPGSDARLGGVVAFVIDGIPNKIKNPRVEVLAYQATCAPGYTCLDGPGDTVLTYGEAGSVAQARGDGTDPLGYRGFTLGGGGSAWLAQGGSAHCVANLFYFDNSGPQQVYRVLATTAFEAAG